MQFAAAVRTLLRVACELHTARTLRGADKPVRPHTAGGPAHTVNGLSVPLGI